MDTIKFGCMFQHINVRGGGGGRKKKKKNTNMAGNLFFTIKKK